MSCGIVNVFESIDIKIENCQFIAAALRHCHSLTKPIVQ